MVMYIKILNIYEDLKRNLSNYKKTYQKNKKEVESVGYELNEARSSHLLGGE
jgi:hypothetical protein